MPRPIDPSQQTQPSHHADGSLTADAVKQYLLANPDFILDDMDLIASMSAPRNAVGDNVLDLQSVIIERLQHKVGQLRDIQAELIDAASINALTRDRVLVAVLKLMDAKSFEELIAFITEPSGLAAALDLDTVALAVESKADVPGLGVRGLRILEANGVDALIGSGEPYRLSEEINSNPGLYGGSAPHVRSEALVRLTFSNSTPPGILALGSAHPEQFHPSQAADLLEFMGRVVERAVRLWLDLPRGQ